MSVVFRADDVPVASRLDYWHHVVGEAVGPHDVRIDQALDRRDRLAIGEVGPLLVGDLSAGAPAEVRRTSRHVREDRDDLVKVHVLAEGRGVVEQDGRQALLGPGDLVLVDLARPARWAMSAMRSIAVVFPRVVSPLPADATSALRGVRVPGDAGAGALASSLVRQLPGRLDDADTATSARLGTAVLDLLVVALAARLGDSGDALAAAGPARARTRLVEVLAFVDRNLDDPDLTPRTVAAAHHVSLRSLHALFAAEGETVAAWIRRQRLDRCRHDLLDPDQVDVPVSAIAARWGLTNPSQFSRAFRAAYDASPVEYRRRGLRPG